MDESTNHGYLPEYVADEILKAILRGDHEITIASFTQKIAILLRAIFPSIYFRIMEHRMKKLVESN